MHAPLRLDITDASGVARSIADFPHVNGSTMPPHAHAILSSRLNATPYTLLTGALRWT